MKYQDGTNTVNGHVVGIRQGAPLRDALDPTNDGYEHLRDTKRIGTVLQDADPNSENPTPKE